MTPDETVDPLTVAAAFDQRTVGEGDAMAWHAVLGDLNFADAKQAILGYYADTRERIMPADVRQRVKAIQDRRLQDTEIPTAPLAALMDDPPAYLAAVRAANAAIAAGRDPETAMRAVTRTTRPELEAL
jgi:hypothetical protein